MKSYFYLKCLQFLLFLFICLFSFLTETTVLFFFLLSFGFFFFISDIIFCHHMKKVQHQILARSYTDYLTRLPNQSALKLELLTLSGSVLDDNIACITIYFDNIHQLNRIYGHKVGDAVFRDFAAILKDSAADLCFIGRKSGNKFLAIFKHKIHENSECFLANIAKAVQTYNRTPGVLPIQYHTEAIYNDEAHFASIYDLIKSPSKK